LRTVKFELYNNNTGILKSPEILGIVRDRLSVEDKNARFAQKYNKYAESRKYIITRSGRFPIGLFKKIKDIIDSLDIPVEYEFTDEFKRCCIPSYDCSERRLAEITLTPHPYQSKGIQKMMKIGRGVILVGTGGGKTLIMSVLTGTLFKYEKIKKVLIIVPTLQLVEQS